MPDHRGQTYDPQEPHPQGGWFRLEERPYPERLDWAFRVVAGVVGVAAAIAAACMVAFYAQRPPASLTDFGLAGTLVLILAAMAYGAVRAIGMLTVGIYGTIRDGSEFVVDWRAVRHDLPLRRTWIVVLEGALLLAAGGMSLWGLLRFIQQGETFGLATFAVIQTMTYWPMIRRRIAAGRTRG